MENISQMSLIEIAVSLMEAKTTPQNIHSLIKETLEMKGLDDSTGELAAQLYIDITTSSKFVYMGEDNWDLKIRQSLEEFDKDGAAFNPKTNSKFNKSDEDEDSLNEEDDDLDEDSLNDEDEEDDDLDYDEEDDEDDEGDYDEYEYEDEDDSHDSLDDEDFDEDKYNEYMDEYEDEYDN